MPAKFEEVPAFQSEVIFLNADFPVILSLAL